MRLWRYYDIDQGVSFNSSSVEFKSGLKAVKSFDDTSVGGSELNIVQKKRSDCPKNGCSGAFESAEELVQHQISGNHTYVQSISSSDKIKSMFAAEMHASAPSHTLLTSTPRKEKLTASSGLSSKQSSVFSEFGWALPTHSKFKFNVNQKSFLYKVFMEVEKNGNKKSLEEAERMLRKKFKPKDCDCETDKIFVFEMVKVGPRWYFGETCTDEEITCFRYR